MKNNTKKLATLSIAVSLAMVLSYVDKIITSLAPLPPGIKLGLANIAVVFAIYKLGVKEGVIISVVRVILASFLFGTVVSFWYATTPYGNTASQCLDGKIPWISWW